MSDKKRDVVSKAGTYKYQFQGPVSWQADLRAFAPGGSLGEGVRAAVAFALAHAGELDPLRKVTSTGQVEARPTGPTLRPGRDLVADALAAADAQLGAVKRAQEAGLLPEREAWAAGTFGARKVLLRRCYDRIRRLHPELTWEQFGATMVQAHKGGAVVLSRADLRAAMPADEVEASAVRTDGAEWNFVTRDRPGEGAAGDGIALEFEEEALVEIRATELARERLGYPKVAADAEPLADRVLLTAQELAAAAVHDDQGRGRVGGEVVVFGEDKVFIGPLWRAARDAARTNLDLRAFKRALVQANAAGEVVLTGFDLVGAVPAGVLKESDTGDREFHVLELSGTAAARRRQRTAARAPVGVAARAERREHTARRRVQAEMVKRRHIVMHAPKAPKKAPKATKATAKAKRKGKR